MRDLVLLHAKADPAAEAIASVLAERTLVRFAIGDRRADLRMSAPTLVVWSAEAQARGWDAFAPLIAEDARLFLMTIDNVPAPQAKRRFDGVFAWEQDGINGLLGVLRRSVVREAPQRRGGMFRTLANAFAVFGLFAVASGASASATPADLAGREANLSPGERMVSQREMRSALAQPGNAVQLAEAAPALDVDALAPGAPATYDQVAAALAEAWVQPISVEPAMTVNAPERFAFLPSFRF